MMEVAALERIEALTPGQLQMRLEGQRLKNMTEASIREVAFVEGLQHPVVEHVQFRIEKMIIRFKWGAEQACLVLKLLLHRGPRVRQHPAERRHRPAVAHEPLEKVHVIPDD